MKYEEPSGQTVREILTNYEFQIIAMSDDDTGEKQRNEAEAAINAHVVHERQDAYTKGYRVAYDEMAKHCEWYSNPMSGAQGDAAIAKYKEGGNHEGPRSTRPM